LIPNILILKDEYSFTSFSALIYLCNMIAELQIPGPVLFNPLKHHLGFIKEFIYEKTEGKECGDQKKMIKELKHLGTSVMDIYTGSLQICDICKEVIFFLEEKEISERNRFSEWTGIKMNDFRIISLSDGAQWTLKYHDNNQRYVHIFPARGSQHTFRVKSNTLKSALLYNILIGKDFITSDDLNRVRPMLGLSPIKDPIDTEAITEMIEILRELA
jgi:hypothetical protein